jgi:hypothetical protein
MSKFDWTRIERNKNEHRAGLAALSPENKVAIIERLRDEGMAMKRNVAARARESEIHGFGGTNVTSSASMRVYVMGANATAASAVTAKLNSTAVAKVEANRTR